MGSGKRVEGGLGIPCSIHLSYRGKNFRKPYLLRVYSDPGEYHYTPNLPDCPQKVAIVPVIAPIWACNRPQSGGVSRVAVGQAPLTLVNVWATPKPLRRSRGS